MQLIDRSFGKVSSYAAMVALVAALTVPLAGVADANHETRTLEVTPETASVATGTSHVLTATLSAAPTAGTGTINVDFELESGPNNADGNTPESPDKTCSIAAGATTCTENYTGSSVGTDTWRAWIDHDGLNPGQGGVVEADTAEGADASDGANEPAGGTNVPGSSPGSPNCPAASGATEPDCTDVVTITWTGGAATTLDCDDATGPDAERETNPAGGGEASNETYTCTVRDGGGNPINGVSVNAEVETPINDPDATDGASYTSADYSPCTTAGSGTCTITVTQNENEIGTTDICFWLGTPAEGGDNSHCGSELTNENQAGDSSDAGNDLADQVEKTWADRAASGVDAEPETASNALGTTHVITATVYDQFGAPFVGNTTVNLEFFDDSPTDSDANDPTPADRTCTTSNSSTCTISYAQSITPGTDLACVWLGTSPPMAGNNTNGTCDGEGLNDADDASGSFDAPEPATDNQDIVQKTWTGTGAATLDCDDSTGPDTENETNPAGGGAVSNEVYTCTVRSSAGNPVSNVVVSAEVETNVNDPDAADGASYGSPDYTCTTGGAGTCTVTVTQNENETGTATICFWVGDATFGQNECDGSEPTNENQAGDGSDTGNDLVDQVQKIWEARVVSSIDAEPETDTNAPGTSHVVTATVYDQFGDPFVGNTTVNLEFFDDSPTDTDQNDPTPADRSCATSNSSTCSITYSQASTGVDLACLWIGGAPGMSGNNTNGTCDNEGLNDADDAAGSFDAPAPATDNQDVVQKTWQDPTAASRLDCSPETDQNAPGTAHTVTCTATNSLGAVVANARIDAEATGTNDPDNANSSTSPDFGCTTAANGTCSFIHGPGGTGTTTATGTTTYRVWIDSDNNNTSVEADQTEAQNESATPGTDQEPDDTDVVDKTWSGADGRTIDCEPETDSNPVGTSHTVTCTVRDRLGQPVSGEGVTFTESGPGTFTGATTPTTNAQGVATATVTSTELGEQSITGTLTDDLTGSEPAEVDECDRAAGDPAGAPAGVCSDTVAKTWTQGEPASIEISPAEVTNSPGDSQIMTATVMNAQGEPVPNANVVWDIEGIGAIAVVSPTTGPDGTVDATVTSNNVGNTFITATTSPCAPGGDCEDSAVAHWGPASCDVFGTSGSDVLEGGPGGQTICGFGGNDFLSGGGGNDILRAGGGRDVLDGDNGDDLLKGGNDDDILRGGRDDDVLKGGRGDDSLNGQQGRDDCKGGAGRDTQRNC
ncbi:MAG: Ig-like domain-containing protein [Actinomycetota bacterium]